MRTSKSYLKLLLLGLGVCEAACTPATPSNAPLARKHPVSIPPAETHTRPDLSSPPPVLTNVEKSVELETQEFRIKPGSSFFTFLKQRGLPPAEALTLIAVLEPLHNIEHLAAGTRIDVGHHPIGAGVEQVTLHLSELEQLVAERQDDQWQVKKLEKRVTIVPKAFHGTIKDSLWNSAVESGLDPWPISQMAYILGWQIDFAREVRPGDRWRILLEQRSVDNQTIGWGNILAVEYHRGDETFIGFRHEHEDGRIGYYDRDGESLKGIFLRSPIEFARISSGFSRARFHPVLKIRRPHFGIDYAARRGTPVKAVGRGVIRLAGQHGGCGKTVKIRHNNNYETVYCHLSRLGKGIRHGVRVQQGQVIGFVGATGLATGPHLHFEFREKGRHVDPMGRKFPRQPALKDLELQVFLKASQKLYAQLPNFSESIDIADKEAPQIPVN